MIFYVYLEPEIVAEAGASGRHAVALLVAILRGFLQNCCVMEFVDRRIQDAIGEQVKTLAEDFDRKIVKSALTKLAKHNRFVYCIEPDYDDAKPDFDMVLAQVAILDVDLLLVTKARGGMEPPGNAQVATLLEYNDTPFETERSCRASDGSTCGAGKMTEADFVNQHFRKGLKHATVIDICDKLVGSKWGDNYEYTMKRVLEWLGTVLACPAACRIRIHTEQADGSKSVYIKSQLQAYKGVSLGATQMEIRYYAGTSLPHQRFVVTDQFALSIDRGMDFIDRTTRRNRDVEINTKNVKDTTDLLDQSKGDIFQVDAI